ncbi:hypothetical protein [Desulforegula conservatrix]|uniref:hypothetical protein n=1 Tax=Desulforegula conservatrix TaxID=153026 RepID=UPI0012EB3E67|nr:hypothetical protein [Desulforegula conservatrix]
MPNRSAVLSMVVSALTTIFVFFVLIMGVLLCSLQSWEFSIDGSHLKIAKEINISMDYQLPVTAQLDTEFKVPFQKEINFSLPIQAELDVPIRDIFNVKVDKPIKLDVDNKFPIEETVQIKGQMPLETTVDTEIMGIPTRVPIKGMIPLDFSLPLKHNVRIKDQFDLKVISNIPSEIRQNIKVPLELVAKGNFALNEEIPVPIKGALKTRLGVSGSLPCLIEFDMHFDPLKGFVVDQNITVRQS